MRGAQNIAADFPHYQSDRWVEVQHYQQMDWLDLIELFSQYNLHLCRVIDFLPENVLHNLCNIGKQAPVTWNLRLQITCGTWGSTLTTF